MTEGLRIEAGGTGIGPQDLKPWGELRGYIAWTIVCFSTTSCIDKEASLQLLEHEADAIIALVREHDAKRESSDAL